MPRAVWNGVTLAETDASVVVEGNHYFPPTSIHEEYFRKSEAQTVCGWKGEARYYHVFADGQTNHDAAWYYPEPQPAAAAIRDRVAFWKGVQVEA